MSPRLASPPRTNPRHLRPGRGIRGQALIESFLVILVVGLLLFGLLQVALVFNAREILHHSAARAARARTVGFNAWMVDKALRVAAIPNSGALLEPLVDPPLPILDPARTLGQNWDAALDTRSPLPRSERALIERARIPDYLASDNRLRASYILNYEEWERGTFQVTEAVGGALAETLLPDAATTLRITVRQRFPLQMPMHRLFYAPPPDGDGVARIDLSGESEIVNHYTLYLEDQRL